MKTRVPVQVKQAETAVQSNSKQSAQHQRAYVDSRPETAAQRKLAETINNGLHLCAQRQKLESLSDGAAQRVEDAAKPNNTGLPDKLKSGIESLSGLSMDNVKVHYNSSQPAQLNALAYAQGTDIHLAPGQEQHLPHEAWHVVQQAQGRVKPTMQMKDGVPVNGDVGLEKEADVMGGRAVQRMEKQKTRHELGISHDREQYLSPLPPRRYPIQMIGGPDDYATAKKNILKNDAISNTVKNLLRDGAITVTRLAGRNGESAVLESTEELAGGHLYYRGMPADEFNVVSVQGELPESDSYLGISTEKVYSERYVTKNDTYLVEFSFMSDVWAEIIRRGKRTEKAEDGCMSIGLGAAGSKKVYSNEQIKAIKEQGYSPDETPVSIFNSRTHSWRLVKCILPSGLHLSG